MVYMKKQFAIVLTLGILGAFIDITIAQAGIMGGQMSME
jgi:hypothetical protein